MHYDHYELFFNAEVRQYCKSSSLFLTLQVSCTIILTKPFKTDILLH